MNPLIQRAMGAIALSLSLLLTGCSGNLPVTTGSASSVAAGATDGSTATPASAATEAAIAAESGANADAVSVEPVSGTGASYPVVIPHAFGETVLQRQPERIATIAWGNHDVPLALGIVPVGISKANYGVTDGSGLLPWTSAGYRALGVENPVLFDDVAGLDFEAISAAKPDVILAAYSGITKEEYELLSQIAPVVAYPANPWQTYWRDQIVLDATGMGRKTEGEALVAGLEALIDRKTAAHPVLAGKSAVFLYFNPASLGKFYVYMPEDPRAAYLTDLGMTVPDSVKALAEQTDSFALEISAEQADRLSDADLIITYGTPELLPLLQADALLGTIPAIRRGSVAVIADATPLAASGTPSALSIPATIDEYLTLLSAAAAAGT